MLKLFNTTSEWKLLDDFWPYRQFAVLENCKYYCYKFSGFLHGNMVALPMTQDYGSVLGVSFPSFCFLMCSSISLNFWLNTSSVHGLPLRLLTME